MAETEFGSSFFDFVDSLGFFFLMSQASMLYILRTSWLLKDRIHFLVDGMGASALEPCIQGTDTIINKFGLHDLSWEFQT